MSKFTDILDVILSGEKSQKRDKKEKILELNILDTEFYAMGGDKKKKEKRDKS